MTSNLPNVGDWHVTFAYTATDATVASFDCTITKLSKYVSPKIGDLEVSIPIPNEAVGHDAYKVLGGEGKMSMYAYRGNDLWWGGFVDSTEIDSGGQIVPVLTVHGASFEAYPDRREIRHDMDLDMDQMAYAKFVWDYIQIRDRAGGNILVDTSNTGVYSGQNQAASIIRSDIRTAGNLLKDVANRIDGFEWIIDCHVDDTGMRHRELVTGYPTIGRPNSDYVLNYPGNALSYKISGDALAGAVSFQARGKAPTKTTTIKGTGSHAKYNPVSRTTTIVSGSGTTSSTTKEPPIMSDEYTNDALIAAGYTLTDATVDRSTIEDVSVLNDWANLARSMRSGPLVLPTATARMDGFNQAVLGSNIRLRITDYPFPTGPNGEPGWQGSARVIGYEVNPGEYGTEDVVSFTFENPYDKDNMQRSPDDGYMPKAPRPKPN